VTEPEATGGAGTSRSDLAGFIARLFIAALFIAGAFILWRTRDALVLAFGSIMLGVGFRGLTEALKRRTKLPDAAALAVVVATMLAVLVTVVDVFGSTVAAQYGELSRKLPEGLNSLVAWLDRSGIGREIDVQGQAALRSLAADSGPRFVAGVVTGVGQALTYGLVMIASGVFLAMQPERYRSNFLGLIPPARRERYGQVLAALAETLRRWLLGRLVVMAAVGVMSSFGLWALGIDAPFAIGLTGAVLTFIPYVGSVAAVLPGALIGFLQEPFKAVEVILLFWAVHTIEGTFITPYVQDETVDIPPVLSIFSTVVFGLLLGPAGVFLAAPLTVVLIVLVDRLYIEDVLGEEPIDGKKPPRGRFKFGWGPSF
jgi:predicted PurR-regulated permease PerM